MSSPSAVRAGGVFVEIGADPRKFFSALNKVNKSLANMGGQLVSGGGKLAAAGAGMSAPIIAAVRQGQRFESTLLNIRASTGATAAELGKIRDASMQMSQALGVGPTEAAGGMLELLKAGMSLDTVLGGAGKTAMEFAKVGEMDVGQAAVVMSDAMNVFKVSADVAANALSSAADASSTSIAQMSEAFSMSSAVAGLANQSIGDLSAALAILANNGVKGSDAGTSVKTMLMRLMAPADDAVGALRQLGLTVGSFRGADGQMLPMVDIIRLLNDQMQGLDQTAKDDIFRRLFGADAIRAASILASAGVEGFTSMQDAMSSALPVGEKYKVLMSGLAGAGGNILAAMQRLAISISDAVAPALAGVVPFITGFIDGLTRLATDNKEAIVLFAQVAAGAVLVGGAMAAVGYSLKGLSGGISLVLKGFGLFSALASPVLLVAAGIGAAVFALYKFKDQIGAALGSVAPLVSEAAGAIGQGFGTAVSDGVAVLGDLATTATTTFNGVYDAIAAGDLAGAMDILWAGLQAGWLRGVEALMSYVDPWIASFQDAFTIMGAEIYKGWDALWVSVGNAMNTAGAVLMGAMDNIINPILAMWDTLEAGILKSWNYIQSFFKKGFDLKEENEKVDSAMSARKRERELARPGVAGRVAKAAGDNAAADLAMIRRRDAVDAATQATISGREGANQRRAADRRAATVAAEGALASLVGGKAEAGARNSQVDDLLASIKGATSVDQLAGVGGLGDQFTTLRDLGRLTSDQETMLSNALDKAAESLTGTATAAQAGAAAAGDQSQQSMGSIAGTFSSLNLGSVFGGTSLAERTARAAEETAKNTRKIDDGGKVAE